MDEQWYVKLGHNVYGPMSEAKLRQFATDGIINEKSLIKGSDGRWIHATEMHGLFRREQATGTTCPLCKESIKIDALFCKHCGQQLKFACHDCGGIVPIEKAKIRRESAAIGTFSSFDADGTPEFGAIRETKQIIVCEKCDLERHRKHEAEATIVGVSVVAVVVAVIIILIVLAVQN
ncbi:MAG: GYF domain-containing protein [Gemmataceae bacterium]|nr:GYF domain-containing protein [Gemmataceae bacterium]